MTSVVKFGVHNETLQVRCPAYSKKKKQATTPLDITWQEKWKKRNCPLPKWIAGVAEDKNRVPLDIRRHPMCLDLTSLGWNTAVAIKVAAERVSLILLCRLLIISSTYRTINILCYGPSNTRGCNFD